MCVILVSDSRRMSDTLLASAVDANPDGNGFAWIADGVVKFEKSITLDRAQELAATVALPYIFHARIATVGGINPALCHPFAFDRRGSRDKRARLRGSSKAGVLFHNGTWSAWEEWVDRKAGAWSDSMAMATLLADFPEYFARLVPSSQRVAILRPTGVETSGLGWHEVRPGIRASNRHFDRGGFSLTRRSTCRLCLDPIDTGEVCVDCASFTKGGR
jgi:predicted glutamine amidotransferase